MPHEFSFKNMILKLKFQGSNHNKDTDQISKTQEAFFN
jgi:hypothetical protein